MTPKQLAAVDMVAWFRTYDKAQTDDLRRFAMDHMRFALERYDQAKDKT